MIEATDTTTLQQYSDDFSRLQKQKAKKVGGVEARVLTSLAMLAGEHHVKHYNGTLQLRKLDPNKVHLNFNVLGARKRKTLGRLSAIAPKFGATPDKTDAAARDQAQVVDKLITALDQKLDQTSKTREILEWMYKGGVAFEYVPWIPDVTTEPMPQFDPVSGELLFKNESDGSIVPESQMQALVGMGAPREAFVPHEDVQLVGDVGSEIFGPLNVFVDQGVKSIADLAPDQAVYIARVRTLGWIQENYADVPGVAELKGQQDIKIVSTTIQDSGSHALAGTNLKDLIPVVQGSCAEGDPDLFVVVDRYQPASKQHPRGRYCVFVPHVIELRNGDNPYEEIPLVDFHWEPVTESFWTRDAVTDLIPVQKFINKRFEQMAEYANANIKAKRLLGPGIKASDITADDDSPIENGLSDQGVPLVGREQPPVIASWFLNSIDKAMAALNDMAGGADLFSEGKFPGQLRGPLAVPMLQEILDTEWGPLFMHIGERMARVKQMRVNRVKQFYPPYRTMHYTSKTERDEVFVFHTEKVLRAGTEYNITVDRSSLFPEMRALREARINERLRGPLSMLYVDPRTGMPDRSKIAADLEFGDEGRQSREGQYRKLSRQLIELMRKGTTGIPIYPFWDHRVMMDELEAEMATTEFLSRAPAEQQVFLDRWNAHRQYLMQEAQQQQQAMQAQAVESAVAQATQQAAAQAAAETVDASRSMIQEQIGSLSQRQDALEESVMSRRSVN